MMIRLAALNVMAGIGLTSLTLPAQADLQDEMNVFFDSLGNVTDPTITSTTRRGVISGGSIQVRNRIVDTNLVTFTPPSFQAGCGGVDLFGGSFSFVSGDQIVPLFKAVASNAVGYAFQVGLSSICETCMGSIESMQKKVQALNQHFGNSCQLAQGIVNDTMPAASYQRHNDASIINAVSGASEDIFAAQTGNALAEAQQTSPEEVAKKISGNLVWRALVTQNAAGRFLFGDTELLETMMSATGTIIIGTPADGDDGTSTPMTLIPADYTLFDAMLEGGQVVIKSCNGEIGPNECLNPTDRIITLEGFQERARLLLLGDDDEPGIVAKMRDNAQELNEEEGNLMSRLPNGVGGLLFRLASIEGKAAEVFVNELLPHLTVEWARLLSRDLIETVSAATALNDSEHASDLDDLIEQARDRIYQEAQLKQIASGSLTDLIEMYRNLLAVTGTTIVASPLDSIERN